MLTKKGLENISKESAEFVYKFTLNAHNLLEKEDIKDDYSTLNSDNTDPAVRDNIRDKAAKLLAKIHEKRKTHVTPVEAAPDAVGIGNDISKLI